MGAAARGGVRFGWFDVVLLASTVVIIGVARWLWERRLPSLLVVTPMLQAGAVMAAWWFAGRPGNPTDAPAPGGITRRGAIVLATAAALVSLLSFESSQYIDDVHRRRDELRASIGTQLGNMPHLAPAATQPARDDFVQGVRAILADVERRPFGNYDDTVLEPRVGLRGFPGYLLLRASRPLSSGFGHISGTGTYVIWILQALVVLVLPTVWARDRVTGASDTQDGDQQPEPQP